MNLLHSHGDENRRNIGTQSSQLIVSQTKSILSSTFISDVLNDGLLAVKRSEIILSLPYNKCLLLPSNFSVNIAISEREKLCLLVCFVPSDAILMKMSPSIWDEIEA